MLTKRQKFKISQLIRKIPGILGQNSQKNILYIASKLAMSKTLYYFEKHYLSGIQAIKIFVDFRRPYEIIDIVLDTGYREINLDTKYSYGQKDLTKKSIDAKIRIQRIREVKL